MTFVSLPNLMKWFVFLLCVSKVLSSERDPKVIIVGAGAAGIAAACRLIDNNITDVIILEAENRYGGRVNTTRIGEYWADLGAHWVHGNKGNVVYDLASPLGLLSKSQTPGGPEEPRYIQRFYTSSGSQLAQKTANGLENYLTNITSDSKGFNYSRNESYGEYMQPRLDNWFAHNPEVPTRLRVPLTDSVELTKMLTAGGDNWYDVSATEVKDKLVFEGYQKINWRNRTYGTIFDILLKRYPNPAEELPVLNKILFNKKVRRINYSDNGPVKVTTTDGNEYITNHVIFTPSLGVLKATHEELFEPPLSQKNKNAIENLGMGQHATILVYFKNPWWDPKENVINNFVWIEADRRAVENNPDKNWMLDVASDGVVEYKPKLYQLWLAGPYAKNVEKVSDKILKNQVTEFLHKFLGKRYNITEPTEIRKSLWSSNENFRGTASYPTPQSITTNEDANDLGEPVMRDEIPILQFAGEATEPNRYATVNGAISSGWREADRLIKAYSNK